MKVHLLHTIDKGLSGTLREAIGQLGVTVVRDDCFNPRDGFAGNQGPAGWHTYVDRNG